jgi:hypothetical protein
MPPGGLMPCIVGKSLTDLPHEYRNPGKTRMRAVWINTPPTF